LAHLTSKKRKGDSLSRIGSESNSSGRGRTAGWTQCPLCQTTHGSTKQFALGRGIAEHLHAVHTPWNGRRSPTDTERDLWDTQVVELVQSLERQAVGQTRGLDRSGNIAKGYRENLPEFLKAAADGNMELLKVHVAKYKSSNTSVRELLQTRDRHDSEAEHWAAGGGHLACLKYLLELRDENPDNESANTHKKQKIRRREGKNSLHYACRNGRLECVQYLVEERKVDLNQASGDGTTPLHMACFGCHVNVVEYLIEKGADVHKTNDWKCSAAHWVAMSKCDDKSAIWSVCNSLMQHQVSFTNRQSQGHTPLHKAAQKKNQHAIDWFLTEAADGGAGLSDGQWKELAQADNGGHLPSDLWRNAKGDTEVMAKLRKRDC
jgi:Ankyrin repeats (3 copies)